MFFLGVFVWARKMPKAKAKAPPPEPQEDEDYKSEGTVRGRFPAPPRAPCCALGLPNRIPLAAHTPRPLTRPTPHPAARHARARTHARAPKGGQL